MDKSEKPEELNCNINSGSKDDTCEDDLLAANIEIEKLDHELEIAHEEIIHKEEEIELQASELIEAYKELKVQYLAKEKRAAELIIANEELKFQNIEKENRANELIIANKELAFQNTEKEERAKELFMANIELMFQNDEKEKKAMELIVTNAELIKIDEHLKEHIHALEEMMFMISHKVRQPIVNILGLSNLFDLAKKDSSEEIKKLVAYNRESALALDLFTKELTTIMSDLKKAV